jgi:serine/threonine-protein kinase
MATRAPADQLSAEPRRLRSWKEIATYLNVNERTVKRWEATRGLPVHRLPGETRAPVFAYEPELQAWLRAEGGTAAIGITDLERDVPTRQPGPAAAEDAGGRADDLAVVTAQRPIAPLRSRLAAVLAGVALIGSIAVSVVRLNAPVSDSVALRERTADIRNLSHYLLFDVNDQLAVKPGTVTQRTALAAEATRRLDRLRQSPDVQWSDRLDIARAWRRLAALQGLPGNPNLGDPKAAEASLARAEALLRQLYRERPDEPDGAGELGWTLLDRWSLAGEGPRSVELGAAARQQFERALALRPGDPSATLGLLAVERNRVQDLLWTANTPRAAVPVARAALARLDAGSWPPALAGTVRALRFHLLNRLGDALYHSGDIPASLAPYQEAQRLAAAAIAADGPSPHWITLAGDAAFNVSGTLEDLPGRKPEALTILQQPIRALEALLAAGPDAAAEKKLLVLYGQQANMLGELGRGAEALAVSARSAALREKRLAANPDNPQRRRDLAIGFAAHAELLLANRRPADACPYARRADATWQLIRRSGNLGAADASRNAPHAADLARAACVQVGAA